MKTTMRKAQESAQMGLGLKGGSRKKTYRMIVKVGSKLGKHCKGKSTNRTQSKKR